jgi:hypothetical protein
LGFFASGYGFDLDEQPTTHLICEQIRAKRAVQIGFETESLLYLSSGLPLSMGLSAIAAALSQRRLWPLALRDAHSGEVSSTLARSATAATSHYFLATQAPLSFTFFYRQTLPLASLR